MAQIWGQFYIPLAKEMGIKLVSPTFNYKYTDYGVAFLKACVDLEDHPDWPCDFKTMERIALHDYSTCAESDNVATFYGPDALWQSGMVEKLGDYGGYDWYSFINDTPIWVTEVSCALKPWGITQVEACQALTGQNPKKYGAGGMDSW